jgi:hypothetical protein
MVPPRGNQHPRWFGYLVLSTAAPEWLDFLRQTEREIRQEQQLHLACNDYLAHIPQTYKRGWRNALASICISRQLLPPGSTWPSAYLRRLSTDHLERGVFKSVPEPTAAS